MVDCTGLSKELWENLASEPTAIDGTTLNCPTVGQMIEVLSKISPNTPFRLIDADTDWVITHIEFTQRNGVLFAGGSYGDGMAGDFVDYVPQQ